MNIILAVVVCLAVAGVLIFISIRNKTNMAENNSLNSEAENINSEANINAEAKENAKNNSVAEKEEVAKTGDTVAMNYTGRLANGTVFDSNVDPKFKHVEPFVFTLGAGQVISGWDKGIVGMKIGEKKTLVLPPEEAYGAAGHPPVIPQNATLTFDVELLGIKK